MPDLNIAIVGAGIGGLASAAFLARAGHRVTVFDRFEAPRPVGSGLVIQPVGLGVLDTVGLGGAARALGAPIRALEGYEAGNGLRVLDVGYGGDPDDVALAIHRASLFGLLLGAARTAGARIVTGAEVASAPLRGGGRALAFGTGTTEGPFDLVVDASGAGSVLSPLRARPLPFGAIWGTVPWPEGTDLAPDRLHQRYRRADRMVGILPIGRLPDDPAPLATVFWSLPASSHAAWAAAPLAGWKAEATALWPGIAPFLAAIHGHDQMTMARYGHGTLARPFAERLAIIGDAAHRTSPQLGQGANMALLDAAALARALAGHGPEAAPAHYARLRRWHLWLYQATSRALTPQYQSESVLLPVLRDRLLAPLARMPPLPAILTRLVRGDLIPPIRGTARPWPPLRA